MGTPLRPAPAVPLPAELARERAPLLHRTLRELPLPLLEPLLRGLRHHADALVPGSLYTQDGSGGCAVGMMLRELGARTQSPSRRPRWLRQRTPTIWEERPDLVKANPRLAHIELSFDVTCEALAARLALSDREAARSTGLWMAAETQAEINLRHVELSPDASTRALPAAAMDRRLFDDTADRLRQLRPWLTPGQAGRLVEQWVGARRVDAHPLFVPDDWATEVELQQRRLAAAPAAG